ncbi:MAG: hypothetical protein GY854_33395 [Deltaproteobacteria bacterium]|nr:hypothetical protein [Deltaproteobacteria bacterium]
MTELSPHIERNLQEFVNLLSGLRGVVEVRVQTGEDEAWIGLRAGACRPVPALLQQVSRAAVGFGLGASKVHFGILAD